MPGLGRGPPGPGPGRGPGRAPPGPAEPPGRAPLGPGRGPPAPGAGRGPPGPGRGPPAAPGRGAGGRGGRPGVEPWLTPKGLLPGRGAGRGGRPGVPVPDGPGPDAGPGREPGRGPGVGPPGVDGLVGAGAGASADAAGRWAGPGRGPGSVAPGWAGAPWPPCSPPADGPGRAGAAAGSDAPERRPGRGPGVGAPPFAWLPLACPPLAGNASLSRRATGGSIVEDALLTNSPISLSLARTTLLSTPSSFASSCTRALPATGLLVRSRAAVRSAQLVGEHTHRWRFMGCSCRFDLPDLVGGRAPYPPPGLRPRRAAQRTHGQIRRRARRSRAMRDRTPGAAPRDRGTRGRGAGTHLDQATDDVGRARAGDRTDPPPPRHATARRPANGSGNQRRCVWAPTTSDGPLTVYPARCASCRDPTAGHSRARVVPATAESPHTVTNRSSA